MTLSLEWRIFRDALPPRALPAARIAYPLRNHSAQSDLPAKPLAPVIRNFMAAYPWLAAT